jgi:tetratricopeptide (TPR) repeat protein
VTPRLVLLALLAACVPKPVPPTTDPVAEPAPAAASATEPAASPTTEGTAVAPSSQVPAAEAAPAAPPPDDSVVGVVNDAVAMLTTADASRAQRALELLQGQATAHPDVAAIHYNMGVAYQILGQEADARREWLRATEVDPTFAKSWINLGVLNTASGRPDLALASFQAGMRYAPQSVDLRVAAVSVLRQLKRYPEAIAEAKAALLINTKAIPIYTELALVYIDTNQLDLAKFTLEKAMADIGGAKSNARVYAVLGQIYYRLGYSGDAVASFQKSLELDAFQLPALLYLANYHLDNRSFTDAIALLERAAGVAPKDAGVQLNLGIAYRGAGRFEDARKAYIHALELAPSDPEPHRNLAVLYGDYMKAYDAALQSIEDYRHAGGGPPEELDAWITSLKKEQKKIEDKRKREDERRKRDEEEQRRLDEATAPAPAPDAPATPAPGSPAPAPESPAPAPVSPAPAAPVSPAPVSPTPAPAPGDAAPPAGGDPNPWGG